MSGTAPPIRHDFGACFAGIDIGGTKSTVSLVDPSGRIVIRESFPTKPMNGFEAAWRNIDRLLGECEVVAATAGGILAAGISCGGPLSADSRTLVWAPNLPTWRNIPLVDLVSDRLGVPAFMENDANACALAEYNYGAGRGSRTLVFLTFGTGMGAGIIINGSLYRGYTNQAGEVGHVRLSCDGPIGFDKVGSLEAYASGGGIPNVAAHLGFHGEGYETAESITALARQGDPAALLTIETSARYLGKGLAVLAETVDPDRIVIGSVYRRAHDLFHGPVLESLAREIGVDRLGAVSVVPSLLGDYLGDVAALTVAIESHRRTGATPG